MSKSNEILATMSQNNEEEVTEFIGMLETYGLLEKALQGQLYDYEITRYNSILLATVYDSRLRTKLRMR